MKTLYLLFLSFLCLFMTACLDPIDIESNIPEEVITPQATNICSRSVQLNVEFDDAFVLLGTSPNISENNALEKFNYTRKVNDLTPNTTYYYKMIRRRGGYDLDGDVKSFTTLIEVGNVTISSVYSGPSESEQPIIYSDLVLNGAYVKEAGFCFSQESEKPTITNGEKKVITCNSSTSRLESKAYLDNGVKGKNTYVRAYVITDQDTIYSKNSNYFYLVSGFKDGYPYIDLGLPSGLKWAVYNEGSDEPTVGGKMIHEEKLSQKTSWGDNWRLPTKEEALEFITNCKLKNSWYVFHNGPSDNGPSGAIEGKNGNVIYIPYGGWGNNYYMQDTTDGYYWLSTKSYDRFEEELIPDIFIIKSYWKEFKITSDRYVKYAQIRYVTE